MDSEDVIVVSENRFLWGSESNPSAEKTQQKKFKVHIRPGLLVNLHRRSIYHQNASNFFFNPKLVN